MPKSPQTITGSSDAVLQTVAWARKLGFKPVPLLPRSKAALNRDYVATGYQPPPDEFWRRNNYGVGIATGPKHSGPVDVDLDCQEAIFFAKRFLPPTPAIFGRESKPDSHFLYVSDLDAVEKKAFMDPVEKTTIIELRGDGGHQTVMPGSIHQDTGEEIKWTNVAFPDVSRVEHATLYKAIAKVAIATLVSRHLWNEGQRNEVTKHLAGLFFYVEWPEEDTCLLISSVMDYCGDDDKTRLLTVRNTYKKAERNAKVTGAGTLRRMMGDDKVVDRILDWAGSNTVNLLSEYNERYAVVSVEGKFRIADTDVAPGEPPVFFQKDDFINFTGTDTVDIDDKKVAKAKVWLASPRRRSYRSVDFLPGVEDPPGVLNLWTGWATAPGPGDCSAWLKLLKTVICGNDKKLYNWMLHWFANIVREPTSKSLTAPVLIGVQGAGKSLLFAYFGRILGPAYTVVTNEEHIYGRFNRHLASSLLLHSDEALYGGEKRHRGIIKSLITDEYRIFEQKGIDARRVKNHLRLALTSNEAHAAPVESGDRRFTVVDLGNRKAGKPLIGSVLEEMRGDGPAALHAFLLNMDYDPAVPRTNIKNDALNDLKGINYTPMESWWHEILANGQVLPDYLSWAMKPERGDWSDIVSSAALYMSLQLRMRDRNQRQIPNETLFALQLNKMVGATLDRSRRNFNNPMADDWPQVVKLMGARQNAITNLPPLAECRKAFEKYVGQPVEWPGEVPDEEKLPHEKF